MNKSLRIFILSFIIFSIILSPILSAKEIFETKIIVKDIDKDNNIIEGFEYEILFKDGSTIKLVETDKGIHEITLNNGDYVLREIKTVEGYEKSKDLEFSLPVGNEIQWTSELSIFPKHFKAERNYPWPRRPFEESERKEEKTEVKEEPKEDLEKKALEELRKYENTNIEEENKKDDSDKKKEDNKEYAKTGEGVDTLMLLLLTMFAIISIVLAYMAGLNSKDGKNIFKKKEDLNRE